MPTLYRGLILDLAAIQRSFFLEKGNLYNRSLSIGIRTQSKPPPPVLGFGCFYCADLPVGSPAVLPVQPLFKKYSDFPKRQITLIIRFVSSPPRGVSRSS